MRIDDFNYTIDTWINALDQYSFARLCAKPAPGSWSLGQVMMHLAEDTNYYIEQIRICVSTNDNAGEEASPEAKAMFLNNDFPDAILEGAPSNAYISQPDNKEDLKSLLTHIKGEMNRLAILISASSYKGKTKHPGLHYFNAGEWLQFAGMHLRHHLRQKKRLDDFLSSTDMV